MNMIKSELYKINRSRSKYIFMLSLALIYIISISKVIRYENNILESLIDCY